MAGLQLIASYGSESEDDEEDTKVIKKPWLVGFFLLIFEFFYLLTLIFELLKNIVSGIKKNRFQFAFTTKYF